MDKKNKSNKKLHTKTLSFKNDDIDLLEFYEFNRKKYPFLLESSAKGNKRARFSILFSNPKIVLEKKKDDNFNFLEKFDELWKKERININNDKGLPFIGGWFIYLGYELVSEIENKLNLPKSNFMIPDAFAARVKSAIIKDQLKKKLYFVSDSSFGNIDDMFEDYKIIFKKKTSKKIINKNSIDFLGNISKKQHNFDVKKCIKYIYEGEIFQANLSRLWEFKLSPNISSSDIYRSLRKSNPSPFGGLVEINDSCIISSSPERLISVKKDKIETRPIAGTKPRGFSGLTDIELHRELINSSKERAEHLMLVDLERNDISRVCKPGSVKVDEMMVIESYAHVHHIVSNIKGILKENITPGKIFSAVFPGGTITGCPKVRCMEILGELEKTGRGPYTGSFGYVNHSGDLDLNILIRTMLKENEKLSLRAGGGIVADSIPEKETLETEAKANGMLKALEKIRI
tara:strand:+ start:18806 stop:20182 length:1377 start_codon:yes stop_codon:yes gene_type:complete